MMLKRLLRPLASRKVRVALATVIAAFAADWGLHVGEELIFTILGAGVAVILGIAHEDAAKLRASGGTEVPRAVPR
jgi:hypothetical protein